MIVVKLIGGLGNQMFQYATARSVADRFNVPLKLDLSDFEHYTLRRYELDDFNIRADILQKDDKNFLDISSKRPLWRRLRRCLLPSSSNVVRESSFGYNENIERVRPPVYFEGYWQSERYFNNNTKAIREDFTLRAPLDTANREMQGRIESVNAVSLHIRRGDYVSNPTTHKFHGLCSIDYYQRGIDYIVNHVKDPNFFVFSDDQEWAQQNLSFQYPTTFVTCNSSDKGVFDMFLMQKCKHHIIANSSFSWWGAWLNPAVKKHVIAPKRWFNAAVHDTRDLLPVTWILM